MTLENGIRALAGTLILASLALSRLHSEGWLLLTAFVGLNLLQSAVTGICPAAAILKRWGLRSAECSRRA